MNNIKLQQGTFYYYDSSDPVVDALKQGYLFGANNWSLIKQVSSIYPSDGCVVDVGAHIGTFSYEALTSDDKYILVEADETNCQCLRQTFNGRDNVNIVEALVSDRAGRADFSDRRGPFGWIEYNEQGKYETRTIDDILKNEKVKILKLDIEGSEILALNGATQTLAQRPLMIVEVNGYCLMQQGKCSNHLLQKIDELRYDIYMFVNGSQLSIDPKNFFPFCVADVVCIPKEFEKRINAQVLPNDQAEAYYNSIKDGYNSDCKSYFEWVGV